MSHEQLRRPRPGPAIELYFASAANNLVIDRWTQPQGVQSN
ncbi:hypothetical protein ACFXPS_33740 [Nocardia sp. NPDC059091]